MLAYIKGTVKHVTDKYLILETNQLGYLIYTTENLLSKTKTGDKKEFYTHQYVKEDALDLYGFESLEELDFFELLITISGVGPKSALGVLALANIKTIKQAILKGDPSLLKKVSGIGQKTAERIVVELKNKVADLAGPGESLSMQGGADSEVIDALEALGYSLNEVRQAVAELPDDITDTQAKIKATLKIINHK